MGWCLCWRSWCRGS